MTTRALNSSTVSGWPPILCDTHGEADGWEELQALLALSPTGTIGYGIVSGTAIVVEPDGTVSALGGEVHRFQKRTGGVMQIESLFPDKSALRSRRFVNFCESWRRESRRRYQNPEGQRKQLSKRLQSIPY